MTSVYITKVLFEKYLLLYGVQSDSVEVQLREFQDFVSRSYD